MIEIKFQGDDRSAVVKQMFDYLGMDIQAAKAREAVKSPAAALGKEAAAKKSHKKKAAPPTVTKVEVAEALQQVNVAAGIPRCREILNDFECAKIGDLKEEHYPAFVAACNLAVK